MPFDVEREEAERRARDALHRAGVSELPEVCIPGVLASLAFLQEQWRIVWGYDADPGP